MNTDGANAAQRIPFVRRFDDAVTLIDYDGRPVVVGREFGSFLGYAEGGKKLVDLVSGEWSDEFLVDIDFILLRNGRLAEFKRIVGELGLERLVDKRAPALLLLTESGIQLVLARSEKDAGRAFRRWLVSEVIPEYHQARALPGPSAEAGALPPPPPPAAEPRSRPTSPAPASPRRRRREPPAAVRVLRGLLERIRPRVDELVYEALDVALLEVEALPDPLQGLDALEVLVDVTDDDRSSGRRQALLMNVVSAASVLRTADLARLLTWVHTRPTIDGPAPKVTRLLEVAPPGKRQA